EQHPLGHPAKLLAEGEHRQDVARRLVVADQHVGLIVAHPLRVLDHHRPKRRHPMQVVGPGVRVPVREHPAAVEGRDDQPGDHHREPKHRQGGDQVRPKPQREQLDARGRLGAAVGHPRGGALQTRARAARAGWQRRARAGLARCYFTGTTRARSVLSTAAYSPAENGASRNPNEPSIVRTAVAEPLFVYTDVDGEPPNSRSPSTLTEAVTAKRSVPGAKVTSSPSSRPLAGAASISRALLNSNEPAEASASAASKLTSVKSIDMSRLSVSRNLNDAPVIEAATLTPGPVTCTEPLGAEP